MKLIDFFEKHNCTKEERQKVWEYLQAIRIIPRLTELKKLFIELKTIFNHGK